MTLIAQLKIHALQSLNRMGGQPMPDTSLRASLRIGFRHEQVTETHIDTVLRELDGERMFITTNEPVTNELMRSLSAKGEAAAARFP